MRAERTNLLKYLKI